MLFFPRKVAKNLERVRAAGIVSEVPNLWQIQLGVLRMWHRVIFRPESIGMCASRPVRASWRARFLANRARRFPFLIAERAVAPLDFSGLASPPWRVVRHLLGAHHDGNQFAYDLQILSCYPGTLEELCDKARAVVDETAPRSRYLKDLTVYEGYHENLLSAVERALEGDFDLPPGETDNPDISFIAYLRWCAAQPPTPLATLRARLSPC